MTSDYNPIICPACGNEISAEAPLWTMLGKWYCSEKCVRAVGGAMR